MPVQQYPTYIIGGGFTLIGKDDGTILCKLQVPEILIRFDLDHLPIAGCGEILVIMDG
jgi:hypothetical protein